MNSRAKGARGEREAAAAWRSVFGCQARRGQQFAGGQESPDIVVAHPGVHVEVKRTERGNPYGWMAQAAEDCGEKVPVVLHRRNSQEWLLIVRLNDVPRLAQEINAATQGVGPGEIPCGLSRPGVSASCREDA